MKKVLIGVTVLSVVGFGAFLYFQKRKTTQLNAGALKTTETQTSATTTSPAQPTVPQGFEEVNKAIETGTFLLAQQIAEKIKSRKTIVDNRSSGIVNILQAQDEINKLNKQLADLGYKYVDGKAVKF